MRRSSGVAARWLGQGGVAEGVDLFVGGVELALGAGFVSGDRGGRKLPATHNHSSFVGVFPRCIAQNAPEKTQNAIDRIVSLTETEYT